MAFPYLDDGNLVLAALAADGTQRVFRVHKSLMALYSPVFGDMLALPVAGALPENELYDGLPLVRMPDTAEDLEDLLKLLYSPSSLPYKRHDPNTPLLATGALKLSTKYGIEGVRASIVKHLEGDWPSSLEQWELFSAQTRGLKEMYVDAPEGKIDGKYLDDVLPEPASALRIARDYDIPSILPAAFYALQCISTHCDWDDSRRENPNPPVNPYDIPSLDLEMGERTARWRLLTRDDLLSVLRAREMIEKRLDAGLARIRVSMMDRNCTEFCRKAAVDSEEFDEGVRSKDALAYFHVAFDPAATMRRGACPDCAAMMNNISQNTRQKLWDELPTLFGL